MRAALLSTLAVAGLAAMANAQTVRLNLLANIDVSQAVAPTSPDRIGTNVSTVAWNGQRLFIGGLNGSGASLSTGLMEVLNPLSATPTLGSRFGTRTTAATRGHTSMSISGNALIAGWDNGAAALGGMTRWNVGGTLDGTTVADWQANVRGGGTDFDPGFAGSSPSAGNIGMALLGSGRRQLLNAGTGAVIYSGAGGSAGFIFNNAPIGSSVSPGSNHRDLAFDSITGDTFVRVANSVVRQTRTGENSGANASGFSVFENFLGNQATAANVNLQTIAFGIVDTASVGKVLFFNDRPVSATSGNISSIIRAIGVDGSARTLDFGGFSITSSTGAYDFSWNQATNTLAVSDFSNSRVYIFSAIPTPGAAGLLGLAGLAAARRRR